MSHIKLNVHYQRSNFAMPTAKRQIYYVFMIVISVSTVLIYIWWYPDIPWLHCNKCVATFHTLGQVRSLCILHLRFHWMTSFTLVSISSLNTHVAQCTWRNMHLWQNISVEEISMIYAHMEKHNSERDLRYPEMIISAYLINARAVSQCTLERCLSCAELTVNQKLPHWFCYLISYLLILCIV